MAMRSQGSKKTSQSAAQQVQPSLRSRPFAPPLKPEAEQVPLDLQTQLENAQRFGHHFGQYRISPRVSALPPIQPKLTIGALGDKYEQEADRIATQVVQQLNAPTMAYSQPDPAIQRAVLPEEEDDELQMKPLADRIQKVDLPEEEDKLQMKPTALQAPSVIAASEELEGAITQTHSSGHTREDNKIEPNEIACGADFRGVRLQADTQYDRLNQTVPERSQKKKSVVFSWQGYYSKTRRGRSEVSAHSLSHVVQQRGRNSLWNQDQQKRQTSITRETMSSGKPKGIQRQYEANGQKREEKNESLLTILGDIANMVVLPEKNSEEQIKQVITIFEREAEARKKEFQEKFQDLQLEFDIISILSPHLLSKGMVERFNSMRSEKTKKRSTEGEGKKQKKKNKIEEIKILEKMEYDGHTIVELQKSEKEAIAKELTEWQQYVQKTLSEKKEVAEKSRWDKFQLGEGYYNRTNEGKRAEHKNNVKTKTDLWGCEVEAKAISDALKNDRGVFLVASCNGKMQGILQIYEHGLIANIVVHPHNILPPDEKSRPVKNTLKAMLRSAVQWNMNHEKVALELCALSSRVKKIYDNYGFRVFKSEEETSKIDRPLVERILESGISYGWKKGPSKKEDWHNYIDMRLDVKEQQLLLNGTYEGYLTRTENKFKQKIDN